VVDRGCGVLCVRNTILKENALPYSCEIANFLTVEANLAWPGIGPNKLGRI